MTIHRILNNHLANELIQKDSKLQEATQKYERLFHPMSPSSLIGKSQGTRLVNTIRSIALFVFTLGFYPCLIRSRTNQQWTKAISITFKAIRDEQMKPENHKDRSNPSPELATLRSQLDAVNRSIQMYIKTIEVLKQTIDNNNAIIELKDNYIERLKQKNQDLKTPEKNPCIGEQTPIHEIPSCVFQNLETMQ